MSVRRTDKEKHFPPGKFMSVRGKNGPSWKIIKRLLLEKKNRYFRKLSRWLLLVHTKTVKIATSKTHFSTLKMKNSNRVDTRR